MSEDTPKGQCLLARAAPVQLADDDSDLVAKLTMNVEKLTVNEEKEKSSHEKHDGTNAIRPSDYITLQSIRSSALANKTNTSSKFSRGGPALFNDLVNKEEKDEKTDEKKDVDEEDKDNEKKKSEDNKDENEDDEKKEDDDSGELLPRGPAPKSHPARYVPNYHPYSHFQDLRCGTAAMTPIGDYTALSNYGVGSEFNTWGNSPDYISQSSTPDTPHSDQGYAPSPPYYNNLQQAPTFHEQRGHGSSTGIPDRVIDYILDYTTEKTHDTGRPLSTDSGVDSPLSAGSAPNASPEVPQGSCSGPTTPSLNQSRMSPRKTEREAKQVLRSLFSDEELTHAWAWAVRHYPDTERNRLMHLVTAHLHKPKIYSLVEQLLKTETTAHARHVFDLPDDKNETPLFLAVLNRSAEVVAYLLEAGANPNCQSFEGNRNTALHVAADYGLLEITKALLSCACVDIELENAKRFTPLLSSVQNHNRLDVNTQKPTDNKPVVAALLEAGANPRCKDVSGRTIFHYAVESADPEMVELFRGRIDEKTITDLVNMPDCTGERPLATLSKLQNCSTEIKSKIIMPLLTYGANVN